MGYDRLMSIQKIIGRNVKRIRESKDWSQCKLSEESGLHYTYISGIERGIRNPTVEIIFRISLALNIKPSKLFEVNESEMIEEKDPVTEE
jgi:transcriptional regulator with XRE-family HTH domain